MLPIERRISCHVAAMLQLVLLQLPDGGSWLNVIRFRVAYTECMSLRENCASRRGHHNVGA
jgi:hypothetical protein